MGTARSVNCKLHASSRATFKPYNHNANAAMHRPSNMHAKSQFGTLANTQSVKNPSKAHHKQHDTPKHMVYALILVYIVDFSPYTVLEAIPESLRSEVVAQALRLGVTIPSGAGSDDPYVGTPGYWLERLKLWGEQKEEKKGKGKGKGERGKRKVVVRLVVVDSDEEGEEEWEEEEVEKVAGPSRLPGVVDAGVEQNSIPSASAVLLSNSEPVAGPSRVPEKFDGVFDTLELSRFYEDGDDERLVAGSSPLSEVVDSDSDEQVAAPDQPPEHVDSDSDLDSQPVSGINLLPEVLDSSVWPGPIPLSLPPSGIPPPWAMGPGARSLPWGHKRKAPAEEDDDQFNNIYPLNSTLPGDQPPVKKKARLTVLDFLEEVVDEEIKRQEAIKAKKAQLLSWVEEQGEFTDDEDEDEADSEGEATQDLLPPSPHANKSPESEGFVPLLPWYESSCPDESSAHSNPASSSVYSDREDNREEFRVYLDDQQELIPSLSPFGGYASLPPDSEYGQSEDWSVSEGSFEESASGAGVSVSSGEGSA
ncbi:hypothetical protein BDN72DRAFT_861474 [Pluteus cervinus]|uniref:Uncharacterized protein n=1 Tax=Pluteus cervinus TaxID=181527 RepID=A0ACD3AEJ1_9AGAR|nr:hypothetical protein BDN72DRAFT_861474 [Pluteus cervinus]